MKTPFWRFILYFDIFVCVLSGIAILITKSNPVPVVIFFTTWLFLVIYIKLLARRP